MKRNPRKRLYVESRIQGALMLRTIFYWGFCVALMTLMLVGWKIVTCPTRLYCVPVNDLLFDYGPAAIVAILLLPLAVLDILRLSNRFVGPFLRLRSSMRSLARGEKVHPIRFRDGDFWQEFAEEFNDVAARVESLEAELRAAKGSDLADERVPVETGPCG